MPPFLFCASIIQGEEGVTDYAVKLGSFVALWPASWVLGFAGAELTKVLGSLGHDIFEQLKSDAAERLTYGRAVSKILFLLFDRSINAKLDVPPSVMSKKTLERTHHC